MAMDGGNPLAAINTTATTNATTRAAIRGLYAITPDGADTVALKAMVTAALAGGTKLVQYRQKNVAAHIQVAQAFELNAICVSQNASLIINDNAELAQKIDAAGVHLGREDMSVTKARQLLGAHKIVGVSCYNQMALAEAAVAVGADYIAFGAFFPSQIKPDAVRAELALIIEAKKRFRVPVVAIGGISLKNAPQLINAGADAVAVISDLFNAPDITAQAIAFQQLFLEKN
jgi:thiamine-phosphate pyrophosphorylase